MGSTCPGVHLIPRYRMPNSVVLSTSAGDLEVASFLPHLCLYADEQELCGCVPLNKTGMQ